MEAQRAGHPVLGVQQFTEPFEGVRGDQQRPPGGRGHHGAEPQPHGVERGHRPGARHGREAQRARCLPAGGQEERGRGPVGPPPPHHAGVRGRREEVRVEGVRAGYRALGVRAGAATPPVLTACARRGRPHSGEEGPSPDGGAGERRVEAGGTCRAPEPAPASPSEDLAHERSFLSVERRGPLHTTRSSYRACVSSLCVHVRRECGTDMQSVPSVRRVDREWNQTDQSGTEQNGAEPSPVKTSRGRPVLQACRPLCNPAAAERGCGRHG